MNRKVLLAPLCLLLALVVINLSYVQAQEPPDFGDTPNIDKFGIAPADPHFPPEFRHNPAWQAQHVADQFPVAHEPPSKTSEVRQATGGPDAYGYTWDESETFQWVDATVGTDSGLEGDDRVSGAIDIGFSFPFYENNYTSLFFSTNGLITFGQGSTDLSPDPVPNVRTPNNYIAPFWADLLVGNGQNQGKIYYLRGGTAPNRFLVLTWLNVTRFGFTTPLTFQAILHENGHIVFQYQDVSGYLSNLTIAIEDAQGWDGLANPYEPYSELAMRFARPAARARVNTYPLAQGKFAVSGEQSSFQMTIRNTGNLGEDTYNFDVSSNWPVTFYSSDGITPLTDTDSNGQVDTGQVPPRTNIIITGKVQSPTGAQVGVANQATIVVRSALDSSQSKAIVLQNTIPTHFAQAYLDNGTGVLSLLLAQPSTQQVRPVSQENYYGSDMAVAQAPNGNFVTAWSRGRCLDENCSRYANEVEYAILDQRGNMVRPIQRVVDHGNSTLAQTSDYQPAIAIAPNGRIGLMWYRYLYNNTTNQYNYNVFFTILDPSGQPLSTPTNITNNNIWGGGADLNIPGISYNRLGVANDNRFFLSWIRRHSEEAGSVYNIYYQVRDSDNNLIRGNTRFTEDTPGSDDIYFHPGWTALTGNRMLLTYQRGGGHGDVYYAVFNNDGAEIYPRTNLSNDGLNRWDWGPDAVQLSDGKIAIGWTSNPSGRFAILDGTTYGVIAGPSTLNSEIAPTGLAYISVTTDQGGRAVMTWADFNATSRYNLYYALVDSSGNVITSPTLFHRGHGNPPYLNLNFEGYGNTTFVLAGADRSKLYLPLLRNAVRPPPTPTPTRTPTPIPNPVNNGSFESGSLNAWRQGGQLPQRITNQDKHSGIYSVLLGEPAWGPGIENEVTAGQGWIEQDMQVPASGSPRLAFSYHLISYDVQVGGSGRVWDSVDVMINGRLIHRHGNPDPNQQGTLYDTGWVDQSLDLSAYRGQQITLRFEVWNREYEPYNGRDPYNTWVYIDDVSILP